MNDNNKETTHKRKIMLVQEGNRHMVKKRTEMRRMSATCNLRWYQQRAAQHNGCHL